MRLRKNSLDFWLILAAFVLVCFGLLAIYDATVVTAFRDFGDKLYYFKSQLMWAILGAIALTFFAFFDYHRLLKLGPILFAGSMIFLIAVLIPHIGTKIYGARRWIAIGSFNFQPSEFAKLALIFYASSIMSKFEKYKIPILDMFLVFALPVILAVALVLIQPDFGTALIFAGIALAIYYIGGAPIWHFLLIIPPVIITAAGAIIAKPYRVARLKSFLDPNYDPQGASYQINQILSAISGGSALFGVGIGGSRSKFAFIPEIQSDAIFAVLVEELGFIGGMFLIVLFLFLIFRAINIACGAKDFSGKILACGITALIAIQTFFNLASVVALVPLTGVPLPFISYGGSSLIVTMSAIGILINIDRQK